MPPRALMYRFFAKVYGWTQRQVNEDISLEMYDWYPRIERGEAGAQEMKERAAKAAAAHDKRR
jgi:hypothetical protein